MVTYARKESKVEKEIFNARSKADFLGVRGVLHVDTILNSNRVGEKEFFDVRSKADFIVVRWVLLKEFMHQRKH